MFKLRLLICVTVCEEPKSMLEKTLNSIYENLIAFNVSGINNEDIAVVVIFDGILKVINKI